MSNSCSNFLTLTDFRLANISLYTSSVRVPDTPSLLSPDWKVRVYQDAAYGSYKETKFSSPIEMQHVALLVGCGHNEDLALARVEVYGKDKMQVI